MQTSSKKAREAITKTNSLQHKLIWSEAEDSRTKRRQLTISTVEYRGNNVEKLTFCTHLINGGL